MYYIVQLIPYHISTYPSDDKQMTIQKRTLATAITFCTTKLISLSDEIHSTFERRKQNKLVKINQVNSDIFTSLIVLLQVYSHWHITSMLLIVMVLLQLMQIRHRKFLSQLFKWFLINTCMSTYSYVKFNQ
ncbi:unnamed protein product [Rotaria magnacalcarata]|uniref:Uncharacterized protein n=1 Tax=Rotaria magnacalcarata TaxID=392030 RepID=A0A816TV90_9BILA|nr:unnamed protein product [Rotaria magnacalcarata]